MMTSPHSASHSGKGQPSWHCTVIAEYSSWRTLPARSFGESVCSEKKCSICQRISPALFALDCRPTVVTKEMAGRESQGTVCPQGGQSNGMRERGGKLIYSPTDKSLLDVLIKVILYAFREKNYHTFKTKIKGQFKQSWKQTTLDKRGSLFSVIAPHQKAYTEPFSLLKHDCVFSSGTHMGEPWWEIQVRRS